MGLLDESPFLRGEIPGEVSDWFVGHTPAAQKDRGLAKIFCFGIGCEGRSLSLRRAWCFRVQVLGVGFAAACHSCTAARVSGCRSEPVSYSVSFSGSVLTPCRLVLADRVCS